MFVEFLTEIVTNIITQTGYLGVAFLMALESMIFPIPSEAVMPFAGFLVAEGTFSFWEVVFFSTLGSLIGSLISYYIGFFGGRPFVEKIGKYFFLNKHHLDITENYFKKRGEITILIGRFIPVVRHLISIPAGIGKMNLLKFLIFTAIGAGIWNSVLIYVGYTLKNNWQEIIKYSQIIDIIIIIVFVIVVVYYLYKQNK